MTWAVTSFFGTASKCVNAPLPSVRFEWLFLICRNVFILSRWG